MIVRKLITPQQKAQQCSLPKEELDPNTTGVRIDLRRSGPYQGYVRYREKRARMNSRDPDFCMRGSHWEIDGKPYCGQHAGLIALAHLETKK